MGRENIASLLRLYLVENSIDYLFLLGNTLSPNIILDLANLPGLRLIGVTGNYDNASIATTLKKLGGLVEARVYDTGFAKVYGVGCNVRQAVENAKQVDQRPIDVLASFYPGYKYICGGNYGVESIDYIIDNIRPRLIVYGKCRRPCIMDNIVCLGPGYKGYTMIAFFDREVNVEMINLYDYYLG